NWSMSIRSISPTASWTPQNWTWSAGWGKIGTSGPSGNPFSRFPSPSRPWASEWMPCPGASGRATSSPGTTWDAWAIWKPCPPLPRYWSWSKGTGSRPWERSSSTGPPKRSWKAGMSTGPWPICCMPKVYKKMKTTIESSFKAHLQPEEIYRGGTNLPASGKKIHKLSSNESPLGASPRAVAAIAACLPHIDRYPDQTDIRLREALVRDFGGQLGEQQFISGNGGSEIIDLLIRAFVGEGDQIIVSNPCFLPYTVFSRWYGGISVDVPLRGADFELD